MVEREDELRQRGLVPTPELLEIMGISLKGLEGRVRRGTVIPVVRNPHGTGYNWYRIKGGTTCQTLSKS